MENPKLKIQSCDLEWRGSRAFAPACMCVHGSVCLSRKKYLSFRLSGFTQSQHCTVTIDFFSHKINHNHTSIIVHAYWQIPWLVGYGCNVFIHGLQIDKSLNYLPSGVVQQSTGQVAQASGSQSARCIQSPVAGWIPSHWNAIAANLPAAGVQLSYECTR